MKTVTPNILSNSPSFFLLPPQSKLACLSLLHLLFLVTIYEYDWTFAHIARMNWFPAPLDLYCISCLDPIIFLTFLWSSNISLFLVLSIAHNLAPVLSRSFVHWRRLELYFYFYTQVVLGFGPLFFQCCFGLFFFFFRAGGGYFL